VEFAINYSTATLVLGYGYTTLTTAILRAEMGFLLPISALKISKNRYAVR
jgi:hypothetical protein